jgi:chorismate mutase
MSNNGMEDARSKIDEIDNKIISVLGERADIVRSIAKYKKERGIPLKDQKREDEVIERLQNKYGNTGLLSHDSIKRIMQKIFEEMIILEEEV